MKSYKEIKKVETDLEEACWVGYRKDGMKKKGDRMVPNCVKEEVINAVYGKEWIYEEPTNENVGDMYKGKLSDTQITNLKNLWKNKKQSDVTPSVKSYVRGLDQFTKMDIKQANIKYLSNLIDSVQKEEVDFISPLQDQIEIIEMNSVVRKTDITEAYFSADQLERLAKAYNVMKDKTISLANAKKLGKMVDGIPAGALNDLRKKKIPFISGLALSRMIKLKVPVTETYTVQITKKDGSKMNLGRYNTSDEAQRYADQYGTGAKIVKEDLNKDDEKSVDGVVKQLKKAVKAHQGQVKSLTKDLKDEKDLEEADLSKSQVTKVHKQADDLPKKDFMKRYGKDGDAVRYATATNMVKKKLGIGEDNKLITKGELKMNESYKLRLNSAMDHYKIESLGDLKDEDQKAFFDYVDGLTEGLTAGQKKLPAGLQKAILSKQGDKKEVKEEDAYDGTPAEVAKMKAKEKADAEKAKSKDEMHDAGKKDKKEMKTEMMAGVDMNAMKKEMMKKVEMMNAETDPEKMQEMKKEMMTAMKEMPMEMKKEIMDKMEMAMTSEKVNEIADMKAQAMKMPIRSMMKKKSEDLVGGQKKLDKDKDGDLDAKDFAALRKTKSEAVKTGEADLEPKTKELNAMVKSSHKPDHKGNPIDDMNATYMKSNVKAPVKDNGGADMAVVKDAPKMVAAMAKISNEKKMMNMKAMYGESRENAKRYLDTKPGSLEEAVLKARGLVKEQRWHVDGKLGYKGIGNQDGFEMVINANSESDAEDKAEKALEDARAKGKIGPGGGGRVEDIEVEGIEKTNKSLSAAETYRQGN